MVSSARYLRKQIKHCREISAEWGMFKFTLINDSMNHWQLHFPASSFDGQHDKLAKDLRRWAKHYARPAEVVFEIRFPADYPQGPPFVRVVRPRFQFHSGHVTVNGSVCVELLTKGNGEGQWRSGIAPESLVIMLHCLLISGDARVDFGSRHHPCPDLDYNELDAADDFRRVAAYHGWMKP